MDVKRRINFYGLILTALYDILKFITDKTHVMLYVNKVRHKCLQTIQVFFRIINKGGNVMKWIKKVLSSIFIDGLTGMGLGLFATLIIGTIIKQVGDLMGGPVGAFLSVFGLFAQRMTGVGIGVGVACKFKSPVYVVLSAATAGMIGAYAGAISAGTLIGEGGNLILSGPGEPLGAFIAAYVGIVLGHLVAGKTKVDLIVTPAVTILSGGTVGVLVGSTISSFMTWLGDLINWGTIQQPVLMGIVVSVVMGMVLTLPISSAALGVILGLNGIAAGAATIGCCCQMVGFAVSSFRENGIGGLFAQGLGTSMLQIPNIVRRPLIWIPSIVSSAILGPIAIMPIFNMTNNPTGSGMGSAGLVGQIMTYQTMTASESPVTVIIKIIIFHFILPAVITLGVSEGMRKMGYIKQGDMKLSM